MATKNQKLFSFGIITDLQYANVDDQKHYSKPKWRHYRNSLNILQEAVNSWKSSEPVKFVLHLGDVIDALNTTDNQSKIALEKVLSIFSQLPVKVYYTVGNHELYNFDREKLINGPLFPRNLTFDTKSCFADTNKKEECYYSFSPHPKFLVIILDCYEISILGYSKDHPNYKIAESILKERNKGDDWNNSEALPGYDKRFAKYNGGLSKTQLKWLEELLCEAEKNNQKVIIAGHISLYYKSIQSECSLVWNYEEILDIIYQHPCVVAYLSGHDHDGGHAMDEHGIYHITFPGVIEVPIGNTAYATCDVYEDHILMTGHGLIETQHLSFHT